MAENSYKTEAIGEKLCGKKGRGGWILSRNVRGGSVKIFGGGGGREAPFGNVSRGRLEKD